MWGKGDVFQIDIVNDSIVKCLLHEAIRGFSLHPVSQWEWHIWLTLADELLECFDHFVSLMLKGVRHPNCSDFFIFLMFLAYQIIRFFNHQYLQKKSTDLSDFCGKISPQPRKKEIEGNFFNWHQTYMCRHAQVYMRLQDKAVGYQREIA